MIHPRLLRNAPLLFLILGLLGCVRLPDNVQPVDKFEVERYLGRWYEIARLDHSFEEGLSNVTAQYSLRDDGGLTVLNRGFNERENQWSEAEGKADFVRGRDLGFLKVSFFGPFYSPYVVFDLDRQDYQYAFIAGKGRDYLWLLARTREVSPELKQRFVEAARQRGYPVENLIWVEQDRACAAASSRSLNPGRARIHWKD